LFGGERKASFNHTIDQPKRNPVVRVYNSEGIAVKTSSDGKKVLSMKSDMKALLYNQDGSVWGNGHGPFNAL